MIKSELNEKMIYVWILYDRSDLYERYCLDILC